MMTSLILAAALQTGSPAVTPVDRPVAVESQFAASKRGPQTTRPPRDGKKKARPEPRPDPPKRPSRGKQPPQFI
ncbi:MAG: hypothetical protein ACKVZJ_05985 [Phycisphaerales bacterium]